MSFWNSSPPRSMQKQDTRKENRWETTNNEGTKHIRAKVSNPNPPRTKQQWGDKQEENWLDKWMRNELTRSTTGRRWIGKNHQKQIVDAEWKPGPNWETSKEWRTKVRDKNNHNQNPPTPPQPTKLRSRQRPRQKQPLELGNKWREPVADVDSWIVGTLALDDCKSISFVSSFSLTLPGRL